MRGYPQFSFWISIVLVKIYVSWVIINRGKNTFELVGTVLKLPIFVINPPLIIFELWEIFPFDFLDNIFLWRMTATRMSQICIFDNEKQ